MQRRRCGQRRDGRAEDERCFYQEKGQVRTWALRPVTLKRKGITHPALSKSFRTNKRIKAQGAYMKASPQALFRKPAPAKILDVEGHLNTMNGPGYDLWRSTTQRVEPMPYRCSRRA